MIATVLLLLAFIGILHWWNSGQLSTLWQAANGSLKVQGT